MLKSMSDFCLCLCSQHSRQIILLWSDGGLAQHGFVKTIDSNGASLFEIFCPFEDLYFMSIEAIGLWTFL